MGILLALLTGALLGAVNGVIVTRLGVSSLIATLGTLTLYRGIDETIVTNKTLVVFPSAFLGWNVKYLGGTYITWPQIMLVVLFLLFTLVLRRGTLGRVAYFVGSNPTAALYSGIRVHRIKLGLFTVSGVMCAIAGLTLTSRLESVRNDTATGMELPVITAVLLGGAKIEGGKGAMSATALAVVLIALVENLLVLKNATDLTSAAVIGGLLILSLVAPATGRRVVAQLVSRSLLRNPQPKSGG